MLALIYSFEKLYSRVRNATWAEVTSSLGISITARATTKLPDQSRELSASSNGAQDQMQVTPKRHQLC